MNRKYAKIIFFVMGFVLIGNLMASVVAVAPSMGVSNGDSFDFVVEKFSETDNLDDSDGYYLGYDGESIYAQQGDEFTITFVDVTLDGPDSDGDYSINFDITFGTNTFDGYEYLDGIGGYVVSTDWDAHKTLLQEEIDEFEQAFAAADEASGSAKMIDTSSEFGVKFSQSYSDGTETMSISGESRYEKSTGVLLYLQRNNEFSHFDNEGETDEELHTSSSSSIVKRKGYSVDDDDGFLPGFEFPIIIAAFSIMFIPIILKRRG